MKAALILAAAGAVVAQNFGGEPSCAIPCLTSALSAVGCALTDQGCACASQTAVGAAAASCLLNACPATDLPIAQSIGQSLCQAYSATAGAGTVTSATGTASTMVTSSSGTGPITSAPVTTSTATVASNNTVLSPTLTAATSSKVTNAAATPVALGMGAIAAILGAVAAL